MEIDITRLFEQDTWAFSGSVATHGADAGKQTWAACREAARDADPAFLDSPEALQAFRDHMRGFGAWEDDEINGWDADDCDALLIQLVAGDKREAGMDDVALDDDEAWAAYEADDQRAGRFSRGDDGKVYYYLGD